MKHLTEGQYFKTWAPFFLCTTLLGALAGAVAGGAMGALFGAAVAERKGILLLGVFSLLVNAPISYVFFRIFVSRLWSKNNVQGASTNEP